MKRLLFATTLIVIVGALAVGAVSAKRLLPRAQQQSAPGGGTAVKTVGVKSLVQFRSDRRAIIVTFQNLEIASRVEYSLTYTARGIKQGAGGIITPATSEETRELLFGTCSHGVCRYDTGITNARFTVTTVLKNGRKVVKPFRLRV